MKSHHGGVKGGFDDSHPFHFREGGQLNSQNQLCKMDKRNKSNAALAEKKEHILNEENVITVFNIKSCHFQSMFHCINSIMLDDRGVYVELYELISTSN